MLEIGCNAGRNLHHLLAAGHSVGGIEVSEPALSVMRDVYPNVAERATIYAGPVEERILELDDGQYDTVFTMAVLEHLHIDSEWVFGEIARVAARRIVTIEDNERSQTWRHVPRNYRLVFEALGARQLAEPSCAKVPGIDNLSDEPWDGRGRPGPGQRRWTSAAPTTPSWLLGIFFWVALALLLVYPVIAREGRTGSTGSTGARLPEERTSSVAAS